MAFGWSLPGPDFSVGKPLAFQASKPPFNATSFVKPYLL